MRTDPRSSDRFRGNIPNLAIALLRVKPGELAPLLASTYMNSYETLGGRYQSIVRYFHRPVLECLRSLCRRSDCGQIGLPALQRTGFPLKNPCKAKEF